MNRNYVDYFIENKTREVHNARIMIVEDERIVALDISSSLKSLGYEIAGMESSGEKAVETAALQKPDLILMDIMLKGSIDGIDTAKEIKKKYDIPVIYLTAYADEDTLQRAKLTEPLGYILKPYERRGLHSAIEMALHKHNIEKKLKTARTRLAILSRRLIEVQESERRNFAVQLHEQIGQLLTTIKIGLLGSMNKEQPNPVVQNSISMIEEALNQVRSLSLELRPSMLDDLGLVPALRWYVDLQASRSGIQGKVAADKATYVLTPEIKNTCYRITQEAVTNIVKHSNAESFTVEVWKEESNLNLKISDNGTGFDIKKVLHDSLLNKGIGVLGMQERMKLVGGRLKITSSKEKGTTILAIFPFSGGGYSNIS